MSTELALPQDMREKMKERMNGIMLDLIPEDKLNEMIGNEIKNFFEVKITHTVAQRSANYGERQVTEVAITPFQSMIWNHCQDWVKNRTREFFESPDFRGTLQQTWDQFGLPQHTGEFSEIQQKMLPELVKVATQQLFHTVIGQAVYNSTNAMRESLQRSGLNIG